MSVDEKAKALEMAVGQIEKQFGKGSVMRLGADDKIQDIETVSTGSLGLDVALGVGGFPRGRVIEIYGPESSGKTTLALQTVAEAQRGGDCIGALLGELLVELANGLGELRDRSGFGGAVGGGRELAGADRIAASGQRPGDALEVLRARGAHGSATADLLRGEAGVPG